MRDIISKRLADWFLINKRDLPWRDISDPYYIWISEIILQQTRVAQGLPYYFRFLEEFPDIFSLAHAPLDKVLKVWQGLGYYSRARNMHAAAGQIVTLYNGIFPASNKDLLKLKGIGEYTAAAIASIAFNEAVAVVDGNVIRVLSRVYGIGEPVDKPSVLKEIKRLAAELLDTDHPARHNQALMEFGALHCVPQAPDCLNCILKEHCQAFKYQLTDKIPVKAGKVKVRNRYFHYLVINDGGKIYFQQRMSGDIWEGLFEFPLIETDELISWDKLPELLKDFLPEGTEFQITGFTGPVKHILTHQRLYINFIILKAELAEHAPSRWYNCDMATIHELAVPRAIDNFLKSKDFTLGKP
jgi:A/G-specific adenine glycosylase